MIQGGQLIGTDRNRHRVTLKVQEERDILGMGDVLHIYTFQEIIMVFL